MPLTPAPDADWKLVATTRRSRPASWSGLSGSTVTIVVQLGTARIPWGVLAAFPLISGTTSGTWGVILKALDFSRITSPAPRIFRPNSFGSAYPPQQNTSSNALKAWG